MNFGVSTVISLPTQAETTSRYVGVVSPIGLVLLIKLKSVRSGGEADFFAEHGAEII